MSMLRSPLRRRLGVAPPPTSPSPSPLSQNKPDASNNRSEAPAMRSPGLRRTFAASPIKARTPPDAELAALQNKRVELKSAIRECNERVRRMQLIEKCLDADEMNKLMDLCSKWQQVGQMAAEDLRTKSDGTATLRQVLEAFAINPELLNYSESSDSFGSTTW